MRLRYTRLALADLAEVERYLSEREGDTIADLVLRRIGDAIDDLRRFPRLGRPGRIPTTRELVAPRTPFVVAYRLADAEIHVLAIIHGRRRWPTSL